jgi:DNA repair protein SbcD/Mre11
VSTSRRLRIAHAGDTHIGAGYVHGYEDAAGVNTRLEDFRASWMKACRQMVERRVDLLLFAGDAYRDPRPSQTEQAAFFAGLLYLSAAGIEVVGVEGNHDIPKQTGRTATLEAADDLRGRPVKFYRNPGVSVVRGLAIARLPWLHRTHASTVIPGFNDLQIDEQTAVLLGYQLGALRHLSIEAGAAQAPYGKALIGHAGIVEAQVGAGQGTTQYFRGEPLLPLNELRGLGFAYQAWGHYHRAQVLAPGVAYSGSIDRVDFAEATEDKGWWYLEVEEGGRLATHEFVSVGARPFVDIDLEDPREFVSVHGASGGPALAIQGYDVTGAIVRVRYTATPEVAGTINDAGIRRALFEAGAAYVHGPFATVLHEEKARVEISQDDDPLTAWHAYCGAIGRDPNQTESLEPLVLEALEAINAR